MRRQRLVVPAAEQLAVSHPKMVALLQLDHADDAEEARNVEHALSGPHHKLVRRNGRLTP